MSVQIDQKVVEMQFNNKQFEQNVSTSMSTIEKLKQSLNFKGSSQGLESVKSLAGKVQDGFKELEYNACQAGFSLRDVWLKTSQVFEYQIAGRIVQAGKNIASALTIDPIKTGFQEYETQINAVQTILANTESKGKTLNDVNAALDELNAYADKTIYNFTEMTRNIGTFTAAGVDLDTSVSAIKGIANLAAVSGSTSQQASTAMYQLSQAMASGTVKLMDWNSVVNAGMGGQVFQDALKETAKVHGIQIDEIIKKQGSFRESLSEGWLTTEILTETLSKFTGDLSEEQLKSMGYTEEQIEGIMKMGKTANDAATKVKTFTQLFDTLKEAAQSGWTQTWEIIVGDFEEAKELLTSVSDVIGKFIGDSAEARNEMLENWKELGGRTAIIDAIRNAFEGIISIIKPIGEAFREIFPPITGEQLLAFSEGLRDLTAKLKLSDEASDNLKRTFKGVFAVFDIVRQAVVAVFKAVGSLFGEVVGLGGGVLNLTASLGDWLVSLNETIKSGDLFNKVFKGVVYVVKNVTKLAGKFLGFVTNNFIFPGLEILYTLLQKIFGGMSEVGEAADEMGDKLRNNVFFKLLGSLWKGVTLIASGIAKAFRELTSGFIDLVGATDFNKIVDFIKGIIAGGVGVGIIKFFKSLTGAVDGLAESNPLGGLKDMFGGITDVLNGVKDCLQAYQEQLKANTLKTIATAIAILAASLLVLSLIDEEKLGSAIAAISALFGELLLTMNIVSKINSGKGLVKMAGSMVAISVGMLLLAVATKIMSTMSFSEMAVGLTSMAVGLGLMVGAVKLLPESNVNKAAKAIQKLSFAMLILAAAIKIMSSMSWSEMAVGLTTMAVGLGLMVGAVNLLPKSMMTAAAKSIQKLSFAMLILAAALKIMGSMSWSELSVGLVAMAAGLAAMVVAVRLLPMDIGVKAVGMVALATAMVILAGALRIMGGMSWESIAKGLVALGGAIVILAVGLNMMTGTLLGSAAMVVAALAINMLVPALLILSMMSWEGLLKGLIGLAGAFAVMGIAGYTLAPIVPVILALAGALALVGVGVLAFGVGLTAVSVGLTALAMAFATSGTVIVAGITAIITAIIDMIPAIIKALGEGIIAICDVIAGSVDSICNAVAAIITAVLEAVIECLPAISKCVKALLDVIIDVCIEYVPKIVDAAVDLIIALIRGIASKIDAVADAAVDLIVAFLDGLYSMVSRIVRAALDLMLKFINGLADGIRTYTPLILDAVNNLMSSVFEAIGMAIGNLPQLGKNIVQGLIKGIKQSSGDLWDACVGVVKNAWNGVLNFLGIKSPSRLAMEAGMYTDEGMAIGLSKYANVVEKAAVGVGESAMDTLSGSLSNISDAVDGNIDLQPTIRPVLDLSDVKSGAGAINSMLSTSPSVGVLANVDSISSSMNKHNQNGDMSLLVSEMEKLRKDLANADHATYNINGMTLTEASDVEEAFRTILRAAKIVRRV